MNAFTDRRTMLRGLGALTAGAVATVAAIPAIAAAKQPDPIFGVIDALKAAEARIDEIRGIGETMPLTRRRVGLRTQRSMSSRKLRP